MSKTAVFLLNLGGPDALESVEPFLFNLFYDPAIISLPNPFRYLIAKLISKRRTPEAQSIYAHMGGRSPILENTMTQVKALQEVLPDTMKVFSVMRHWHPRGNAVIDQALEWGAETIICLPLYPQYSTTTTESSYKEIKSLLHEKSFSGQVRLVCCYAEHPLWIQAVVSCIEKTLDFTRPNEPYRLLFSAHGLPEKVIKAGDPYQAQVETTVRAVVRSLNYPDLDWSLAYQSRVGPLAWIGPATDAEIRRAGAQGLGIVLVPIAFVSEHSETLVELDIQYRELAEKSGVPFYERVPTVGDHPLFIKALKESVEAAQNCSKAVLCPSQGACLNKFKRCGGRFA